MWLAAGIAIVVVLLLLLGVLVDRRDRRAGRRPGSNPNMDRLVREEKQDARSMTIPAAMIMDNSWTGSHRRASDPDADHRS